MQTGGPILTLNAGSSSLKFALFDATQACPERRYYGALKNLDSKPEFEVFDAHNVCQLSETTATFNGQQAMRYLLDWLEQQFSLETLAAIGHRVVHGGSEYSTPMRINPALLTHLQSLIPLAPLHMPHNLAAIHAVQQQSPDLPQVACFDTAFHRSMSWNEQTYALPHRWFDRGIRRFGFHGLSYEYIVSTLPDYPEIDRHARIIVAHLGHGASLCAIHKGRSVATTMGFSPLDGVPMATRPGSLDPGIVLWLMQQALLSPEDIEDLLNHQSGLLGLSGLSGDMEVLLQSTEPAAAEAIDYFVHHIHRAIASLTATLGGIDTLIFTGGIGENSATIRQRICQQARWLGISLDTTANQNHYSRISPPDAAVSVWRIPTNEELVIAQHTRQLTVAPELK